MRISQRAYARRVGVTHSSIQSAVRAGTIRLGPDGLVNVAQADEDWRAQHIARFNGHAARAAGQGRLMRAKIAAGAAKVQLANQRYSELAAEYVDRQEAADALARSIARMTDAIAQLPDRASERLARHLGIPSDAARAMLTRFATLILDELGDVQAEGRKLISRLP